MRKDIKDYTKIELQKLINESNSMADFFRKISYAKSGSAYKRMRLYLDSMEVDYSNMSENKIDRRHKTNEETFIENSTVGRKHVKAKIIKQELLKYQCDICKNEGEWNGEKLVLQLDHINGKNNDNRLENLRFLCPNCHSQTATYAGKNLIT